MPVSQAVYASLHAFSPDKFKSGCPIGSGRKTPSCLKSTQASSPLMRLIQYVCYMCQYYHPQVVHNHDEGAGARKKVFLEAY
jgi:hypothetical protein